MLRPLVEVAYQFLRNTLETTVYQYWQFLIAFSGKVGLSRERVPRNLMNQLKEEHLKERFDTDALSGADSCGTSIRLVSWTNLGWLPRMWIKIAVVSCGVQTLSRLNRIFRGYNKKTFILDFKNTYDDSLLSLFLPTIETI